VRQCDTKRLLLPNCIPCFMRFMLYTVCKTLRLSVFNNELFDLIDTHIIFNYNYNTI